MSKFKADLTLDFIQNYPAQEEDPAFQVAVGYIYNDLDRGRFRDGSYVRSSAIEAMYGEGGEIFIETRNTIYRILKGVGYKAD